MIWTPQNGKNKKLVDDRGNEIPFVRKFDDETEEVTLLLKGTNGKPIMKTSNIKNDVRAWEMLQITVKIPGARVLDK